MEQRIWDRMLCSSGVRRSRRCPLYFLMNAPSSNAIRAFTLIELLVVISIITVLLSVLFPCVQRVQRQARSVVCRAHLRQWGQVFMLYLEDHQGRLPRGGQVMMPGNETVVDPSLVLLRGIYDYDKGGDPNLSSKAPVRTEGIALCPMARRGTGKAFGDDLNYGETYAPWEMHQPAPSFRMSYGINGNLTSYFFEDMSAWNRKPYLNVFALKRRDNIPLLFDSVRPSNYLMNERSRPPNHEPTGSLGELVINRHEGTINMLFLDGIVRSIGLKELWILRWSLRFNTAGPWTRRGGVQPEDWPEWMRRFKDY